VPRAVARLLFLGGGGSLVVAAFGPWVRSGHAVRDSYATLRTAERLDLLGGTVRAWLFVAWSFMPLLVALGLLLLALRLDRWAALTVNLAGALAVVFAVIVKSGHLRTDWGPNLAVGAALATVAGTCAMLLDERSRAR